MLRLGILLGLLMLFLEGQLWPMVPRSSSGNGDDGTVRALDGGDPFPPPPPPKP